jgi:hypothetical protein
MNAKVYQILSDLRYQLAPVHATTMAKCTGCENPARGGRHCIDCLRSEAVSVLFSEGVNWRRASDVVNAYVEALRAYQAAWYAIEDLFDPYPKGE